MENGGIGQGPSGGPSGAPAIVPHRGPHRAPGFLLVTSHFSDEKLGVGRPDVGEPLCPNGKNVDGQGDPRRENTAVTI